MYNDNANKNEFNYITLFVQNKYKYVTNMLKIYKHWKLEYFKQKSVTSHATHLSTLGILNVRAVVSDRYPPTVDVPRLSRGSTTFGYLLKFIFYFLIPEQFLGYLNEIATKFHRKWTIIFFQILLDLFFSSFFPLLLGGLAVRSGGKNVVSLHSNKS